MNKFNIGDDVVDIDMEITGKIYKIEKKAFGIVYFIVDCEDCFKEERIKTVKSLIGLICLTLDGIAKLILESAFIKIENNYFRIFIPTKISPLLSDELIKKIKKECENVVGKNVSLSITFYNEEMTHRQKKAVTAIENDENVKKLLNTFKEETI